MSSRIKKLFQYAVTIINKKAIPPQTTAKTSLNPKKRHILTLVFRHVESICDMAHKPDQPTNAPHKTNAKSGDISVVASVPRVSSIMPQMTICINLGAPKNNKI